MKRVMLLLICLIIFSFILAYSQEEKTRTLFPFEQNKKWGCKDNKGEVVIEPRFDNASCFFSEGLAGVEIGNKWGYINETGIMVIEPQFDVAFSFSEGLASVKIGNKWGYIDEMGIMVIEPQFGYALDFSEGLAAVDLGLFSDYWGYIDKTGKIVIKPQFSSAGAFHSGKAYVTNVTTREGGLGGNLIRVIHSKTIDKTGEIISEHSSEYSLDDRWWEKSSPYQNRPRTDSSFFEKHFIKNPDGSWEIRLISF